MDPVLHRQQRLYQAKLLLSEFVATLFFVYGGGAVHLNISRAEGFAPLTPIIILIHAVAIFLLLTALLPTFGSLVCIPHANPAITLCAVIGGHVSPPLGEKRIIL